jgi:class 3 adenylate cyclase
MSEAETMFALLRQSADPAAVAAIEQLVASGTDRQLCRINAISLAAESGVEEEAIIGALLHAARLGLFELSWNVLCASCGGVIEANASLRDLDRDEYHCMFCAASYEPTLDERVEVTFTISPRVRRIAAHDPASLDFADYAGQVFWSSGVDLPEDLETAVAEVTLDFVELPAGDKAILSLQLPAGIVIIFDPVTHTAQFLTVKGEASRDRQALTVVLDDENTRREPTELHPGPLRLSLESRSARRALPAAWLADERLEALLGRRRPFLTAKRLLSNQTFRDIYRTDTLDIDQRLKITSLTFLFTDLQGSTALYDRVGDLVAYDLVKAHFQVLHEIVAAEAGAVVKTIGDAVMATFPTPDRAVAAALRMRAAMNRLNEQRGGQELLLKIGIHEGPCLAVMLNDRQDYFGQTVNIASRVQGLADSRTILATGPVVEHAQAASLLASQGLAPAAQSHALRGIAGQLTLYAIP